MKDAKKVVGYGRCSTADQASSGLGMAAQQTAVRAACERNGWELVEFIADDGESGKDLRRPGLRRALEMIAAGEVSGLVAFKLDRITRSVLDFATLLPWFDEAGATLVALDLGIDTSTPGGRLVANVFASVAEWEREVIAARTKDGLAALRAKGMAVSRPAVADQPELSKRIAALRESGLSFRAVAERLNDEGVPTLRGGTSWRASSVQAACGYKRPPARRKGSQLPAIKRRRTRSAAS
ncbi:MAG: recombinase family protein [Actinomycetota bacterium]|nr:recombinase family protein [Actinomycetota bacterium]